MKPVDKSPAAFRTIAEVSSDLDLPAHVLRFWESKFPEIKPLKRRGGRRYYRPEDVALLQRIRGLLYTEGYTIKGVQRVLREGSEHGPDAFPKNGARTAAASALAHGAAPQTSSPANFPTPLSADAHGTLSQDAPADPLDEEAERKAKVRDVLADLESLRDLLRRHGF